MSRVFSSALVAVTMTVAAPAVAETVNLAEACAAKAEAEQLACYREAANTLQSQVDFFLETPFAKPAEGETTANTYPAEDVRAFLAQLSGSLSLDAIGQTPRRLIVGMERFIMGRRMAAVSASTEPRRVPASAPTMTPGYGIAPPPTPGPVYGAPQPQQPGYVLQPGLMPQPQGYVLPPYSAPTMIPGTVPLR